MLIRNSFLLFLSFLLSAQLTFAQQGTGLIFDDNDYGSRPALPNSMKFTDVNVPVYSLKKYCPIPGNQGIMGSCVGWASAYGALAIASAANSNITDKALITEMARSALYVYNQIKVSGCEAGSRIPDAFDLLKEKGAPKFKDFNPPTCDEMPDQSVHAKAAQFKIKDYNTLFQISDNAERKILMTQSSLRANKPVVIGMALTPSFNNVGPDGHWAPSPIEGTTGGHAMCVVGYDDYNRRFEILNSWGTNYGKGGYVTVSYDDFGKYCRYGFQFNLQSNSPSPAFTFKSAFRINKITGYDSEKATLLFQKIPTQRSGQYYTLPDGAIRKGDYFKVLASGMTKDNYLYIFSLKPDGSMETLFPAPEANSYGSKVAFIPIIPSDESYVEIPADNSRAIMADFSGTDYLVYLFSSRQIEGVEDLMKQVMTQSGDVYARIRQVFGNRLVPESSINYPLNEMGIMGNSSSGYIAPLVLKVNVLE
jgi:hypothetical protein